MVRDSQYSKSIILETDADCLMKSSLDRSYLCLQ